MSIFIVSFKDLFRFNPFTLKSDLNFNISWLDGKLFLNFVAINSQATSESDIDLCFFFFFFFFFNLRQTAIKRQLSLQRYHCFDWLIWCGMLRYGQVSFDALERIQNLLQIHSGKAWTPGQAQLQKRLGRVQRTAYFFSSVNFQLSTAWCAVYLRAVVFTVRFLYIYF